MCEFKPLLSICIPTYNRCQYLHQALDSIVKNKDFDDEVEIVISDNCSTDDTRLIGELYASKYSNIKYFRNTENVRDENFCLALDRGTGLYVKLMNDNHIVCDESIHYIKERIKKHINDRTALFFTKVVFNHPKTDACKCNNFEDFIVHMSYYVTAISCLGAWKDDWKRVIDRTKYSKYQLSQDDWAYQIMEMRGNCIIYTGDSYDVKEIDGKYRSGYNWFEVHICNYYRILEPYIEKGLVSSNGLSLERKTYLKDLKDIIIDTYFFKLYPTWKFDTSGSTMILWNFFKYEVYFYVMIITCPIWVTRRFLEVYPRKILRRCIGVDNYNRLKHILNK